ncbi:hypothetical protein V1525DRAFT_403626 [Lipomyces kononenkoae]|uniref:Uncharacterized protein n=1 Tax=Lipomyces kononenkoae TaxID=34357 RepID=A0ACC3T160_LIPKO
MEGFMAMPTLSIIMPYPRYHAQLLQKNRAWLIPSILVIIAWTTSVLIQHVIALKIITGPMIQRAVYVFFARHPHPESSDVVIDQKMFPDTHEIKLPNLGKLMLGVAMHIASVWYCDHCLSKFERQVAHSLLHRDDTGLGWRRVSRLAGLIFAAVLAVFGFFSMFRLTSYGYVHWLAGTMITRNQIYSFIRDRNVLFFFDRVKLDGIFCYLESFVTPSTATSASSLFALMALFLEFNTQVVTTFVLAPASNALSAGVRRMREAIYELRCWSVPFIMRFQVERVINASEFDWKFSLQSSHGTYSVDIRRASLSVDGPDTPTSPTMNLKPSTSVFRRHKLRLLKDKLRLAGILSMQNTNEGNSKQSLMVASVGAKLHSEQRKSGTGDCIVTGVPELVGSSSHNVTDIAVIQRITMQAENRQVYRSSSKAGSEQGVAANFEECVSDMINEAGTDEAPDANGLVYQHSVSNLSSLDSFTQYIHSNMTPNTHSSSLPVIRRSGSAKCAPPIQSRSMSVSKYRYVANPKFSLPESPVKKKRSISTISVNIMSPKTVARAAENCA